MIPDNFVTLIQKLKEKTIAHKAIWVKTSRDNEFKLDLGKGAITTDRWISPEINLDCVDLVIINEKGDKVDSIEIASSYKEDYKVLVELHVLAKRAYYKVDETFKNIFKELDDDKIIGKEGSIEDIF